MVTSVTSMGRSGLSDWLMQRVTAVILLAYFVYIGCVLVGGTDYQAWSALFDQTWMKIFSLMALLSLGVHAWIGLWCVITDYFSEHLMGSRGTAIRLVAQLVCGVVTFVYMVWGIQILWG